MAIPDQTTSTTQSSVRLDIEKLKRDARKAKEAPATRDGKYERVASADIIDGVKDREILGRAGEEELRKGRVAVVVLAGGQATRLQSSKPKGLFPLKTPAGTTTTLLDIMVERMTGLRIKLGLRDAIPLVIMTSESTHRDTVEHMKRTGYPADRVLFAPQEMLPALKATDLTPVVDGHRSGKPWFMAPSGNGSVFRAVKPLMDKPALKDAQWFHIITVDNCLAKPADPILLGAAITAKSDAVSKVVRVGETESCGLFVRTAGGKMTCIEYSEVDKADKREWLGTGNVAIHLFSRAFMDKAATVELPWHVAEKKVRLTDDAGAVKEELAAWKLESFLFDALPMVAQNPKLLRVERAAEFAPLKNLSGTDSPDTVERALCDVSTSKLDKWDTLFFGTSTSKTTTATGTAGSTRTTGAMTGSTATTSSATGTTGATTGRTGSATATKK